MVYRAYLSQWEDVVSPVMVAVKTLKGEETIILSAFSVVSMAYKVN